MHFLLLNGDIPASYVSLPEDHFYNKGFRGGQRSQEVKFTGLEFGDTHTHKISIQSKEPS